MGQRFGVKPCADAGGEDADGTAFANALGQASFRAVAVAANDAASVFQKEAGELTSLFLVWALQETQRYADMWVSRLLFPLQHTVARTVMLGKCPCCLQWELESHVQGLFGISSWTPLKQYQDPRHCGDGVAFLLEKTVVDKMPELVLADQQGPRKWVTAVHEKVFMLSSLP